MFPRPWELSEDSRITDEGLVSSGRFYYNGLIQILFDKSTKTSEGPAIGFNRLYYWEEKHILRGMILRWRGQPSGRVTKAGSYGRDLRKIITFLPRRTCTTFSTDRTLPSALV